MARRRREELDPDELEERLEEEEDGILRDGQHSHVPMFLRDGSVNPNLLPVQRAKAAQHTEDAVARRFGLTDGLALHRPGFRRVTDAAALERILRAYNDYDAADAVAYKKPSDASEYTGSEPRNTGAGALAQGYGKAPAGAYPLSAGDKAAPHTQV
jgi:hypothetical protein